MDARALLATTAGRLRDAGVPGESRVGPVPRRFGRPRPGMLGEVWRLGALCLDADGGLYATGEVLVVTDPTHPNHRSSVALRRNELRGMLRKAGVPVGTTVVVDAVPLDVDDPVPPLVRTGDGLGVLWTAGGDPIPLARYLGERADLLIDPPRGATD